MGCTLLSASQLVVTTNRLGSTDYERYKGGELVLQFAGIPILFLVVERNERVCLNGASSWCYVEHIFFSDLTFTPCSKGSLGLYDFWVYCFL